MSLKILLLSNNFYPDIGGIEINSEILAHEFIKAGHQVRLVTWTADERENRFPFAVVRRPGKLDLFREHNWADVVFENNPCLRLTWPGLFLGKPNVIALNTWVSRVDGSIAWQDRLKTLWFRRSKNIIAVSDALRRKNWEKAIVITNPYRAELFKMNSQAKRHIDLVFLGRLVSDKGADLAIEALHTLENEAECGGKDLSGFRLTIIGDGPETPALKALATKYGLEQKIDFRGSLQGKELVDCLNQHKLILVPSRWEEPFGNVALEGMACGCIPVVSDGGGLPDAVGKAGLIFKREDTADMVRCIRKILGSKELEEKLKLEAQQHLKHHHPKKVADRYLKVIREAASSRI